MTEERGEFRSFMFQVRDAKREHSEALSRYAELDAACKRITPNWSADGGGGGDSQRLWAMRADESVRVDAALAAVDRARANVLAVTTQVEGRLEQRILRLRYAECLPWPRICRILQGYSDRHIYRVHRRAIAAAEEIWRQTR